MLATEQRATWRFTSGHTGSAQRLPLLSIRYRTKLDELNRACAGTTQQLEMSVGHGSRRVTPTIQASFDDGRTWRQFPLRRSDGRWVATVAHPADADHVSLRASAKDNAGNSVDQTTIRAYGLARPG